MSTLSQNAEADDTNAQSDDRPRDPFHVARIDKYGEPIWFVSLDGQWYMEVAVDPRGAPLEAVSPLFGKLRPGMPLRTHWSFLRNDDAIFISACKD